MPTAVVYHRAPVVTTPCRGRAFHGIFETLAMVEEFMVKRIEYHGNTGALVKPQAVGQRVRRVIVLKREASTDRAG